MKIDPAAVPFISIALVPVALSVWLGPAWLTVLLLVVPVAIALFFRDPERPIAGDPQDVLSPADGRVMHAGPARPDEAPEGAWLQVTIFLSLFDVHINRSPVSGRVERIEYLPGSFLAAFKPESHRNERSEIWIDHGGVPIVTRQVVGLLARRVVCRLTAGQRIAAGDRIGLMKFGSRMDVFVPTTADVLVRQGDQVRAGHTVIARLAPAGSTAS